MTSSLTATLTATLMLFGDAIGKTLRRTDGARFDTATLRWLPDTLPAGATSLAGLLAPPLTPVQALHWLRHQCATPIRPPVGVIGPREATPEQLALAREVGRALAELGLTVLCGGRQGVMEATCLGVAEAGGISVGLLPDEDWTAANPHVTIPLATGIGVARNALIARASLCLTAVGGGLGTLSEIALALQFRKPVFTFPGSPDVPGGVTVRDVDELRERVCAAVLGLGNS